MLRIVEGVKPKDLQVRLLTMPSPGRQVVGGEPGDPAEHICVHYFFTMNGNQGSHLKENPTFVPNAFLSHL